MTIAAQASKFDKFTITSADGSKQVDANNGDFKWLSFDYFENILSPSISGSTTIVATNNAVASIGEDRQERYTSLYSGLPLRAGLELRAAAPSRNQKGTQYREIIYHMVGICIVY